MYHGCASLSLSPLTATQNPVTFRAQPTSTRAFMTPLLRSNGPGEFLWPHLSASPGAHVAFYLIPYLFVYVPNSFLDCELPEYKMCLVDAPKVSCSFLHTWQAPYRCWGVTKCQVMG